MEVCKSILPVAVLLLIVHMETGHGHGGLLEPPMRSVAWKYGFDAPINYDWMSLYCGGLNNFTKNNGKCGLCGDPYGGPYENEKGGVYDTGIIVRHYPADLREIEVKVEITAHHKGYFQFKLCPNNDKELTQECLDRYPLLIREGRLQGDPTRYFPPKDPKLSEVHVLLPQGVTCDRCVLQWTYTAGNNIGRDVQETFVNCADISIGGTLDRIPVTSSQQKDGTVVVIRHRPNLTNIIDHAAPDAVNEVLTALSGNSNTEPDRFIDAPGLNHHGHNSSGSNHHGHSRWDNVRNQEAKATRQPPVHSRWNSNRDPRNRESLANELNKRIANFQNPDSPGFSRDDRSGVSTGGNDKTGMNRHWNSEGRITGPSNFGLRRAGSFHGHFVPTFREEQSQMGRMWSNNIPPPSEVTFQNSNIDDQPINRAREHVLTEKGSHASLLGSMANVAGHIEKNRDVGQTGARSQLSHIPRHFVNQMNELRRVFPNFRQWRRGDGMSSPRQAVRHAPPADTHDFSVDEIRQLVPSLPANIGPRQDVDRRFQSDPMRENWFPRSQVLMQRQRMRQMSRRRPRLPRRIEVHTMAVAQHLLRKYPQLRGRVFLSRRGHVRNQFSHMMNKYARRRNWSTAR